jgi:hypothetical protein
MMRLAALLVASALLLPAALAAAAEVSVVNRATTPVRAIQLAAPGSGAWGRNLLTEALLPGRTVRVAPPAACVFDVRVEYADGREEFRRREDLCRTTELALGPVAGGARAAPSPAATPPPAATPRPPIRPSPTRPPAPRDDSDADTRRRAEAEALRQRDMEEARARYERERMASERAASDRITREIPRAPARTLPEFPWPPPAPSARTELARTLFVTAERADVSLAAVGTSLVGALEQARYSEYSFYRAPGGFALVARLERMADDGTPLPEEFRFLEPGAREPFSLATYVKRLFFAPAGFYRQIVFVVSDQPFTATGPKLDAKGAARLLAEGANRLPREFEALPFTPRHGASALIYEYRKGAGEGDVAVLTPGRLPARTHLERAGILSTLGAR